jgi:nucleotide-binding universal stress UspA family protein
LIRKILVPVRSDGKSENVLAHAAALSHSHNAHIEVTHCRPRPEDLMPFGVPIPRVLREQILSQSSQIADLEEETLRAELFALAEKYGLSLTEKSAGEGPRMSFVEEVGRQVDVIKRHGRLADIIAVAKPDLDRNLGTNTLKAALFHSGRPVLMCPHKDAAPKELGVNVALAWNGSAEAARALAQSMPVIREAKSVVVLSNGSDAGPGTTVEDVLEYLLAHKTQARIVPFEAKKSVGREIMETTIKAGADLLIMGAYGDSHERETLFGGNTQWLVDKSTVPILFSH